MDQKATLHSHKVSPWVSLKGIWGYRYLIWQMTKREVAGRYRGSMLGVLWSFLLPMIMLAIYIFVFSFVFKARWGTGHSGNRLEFGIFLYSGLIIHTLFADCVNKAPLLILGNPNFVKKVVFPLEILPVVSMGSVLIHTALNIVVLLIAQLLIDGLHWTSLFLPLILFPLVVLTMGLSWFLASFGTFVRDIGQLVGVITMVLMFMSPIFYPASALPEQVRPFMYLNPLTLIIEQTRNAVLTGHPPSWLQLAIYFALSLGIGWLGFLWFQKTRKGFGDVI